MLSQVVAVLDLGTPMPKSSLFSRPMMIYFVTRQWHTEVKQHTERAHRPQSAWETKPNLVTSQQLLPCGMAAILVHFKLGCGGNKCADLMGYLMNFVHFTDLIQEAAATYDEKNLGVGSKKATFGVGL